jgi:hypothetical protein
MAKAEIWSDDLEPVAPGVDRAGQRRPRAEILEIPTRDERYTALR